MHDDFHRISDYLSSSVDNSLPSLPQDYQWSDRVWISVRGDWIALYRPLNIALIFLHRKNINKLSSKGNLDQESLLANELIKDKFWIPKDSNIDDIEHQRLITAARSGVFRFICILPTTGCTLQCAYCHQRPLKNRQRVMSEDEISKGLKVCSRLCSDISQPVDILLYGGEPLNAFSIVRRVLDLTHSGGGIFPQKVRLSFTTSGVGMTPNQAEVLAKRNVFVILSIDGKPEINDRVRPALDGTSSFDHAQIAYQLLKRAGVRMGISVTIGKHNIGNLREQVQFLLETFDPHDIGLNAFLHWKGDHPNPYQINSHKSFQAFVEAFLVTRDLGVYAEQPFRRLKPFVLRKPLLKDCSSPGERLVLAPGGVLGFCDSCYPEGRYFYPFDQFPDRTHPDYLTWQSLSSPEMPHCQICPVMTVCGGACRYDACKASGELDGVDPDRCSFERAFLRWMIWELFDHSKEERGSYYIPDGNDRQKLFGSVSLRAENQPFTAGSILK